jgi:tetratricopeptide (TPR) repeat protein
VASIGQVGLALRYETLIRILGLKYGQLSDVLFGPTEGILFSSEDIGSSRHNRGFRLRARHPIIASIIFGLAAEDDASKFRIFNEIMTELDAGFPEDMRLLRDLLQRREFVNTLASHDMRRALFERMEILLPGDPYVWQHRSIIERDMQNAESAGKYARMAKNADTTNRAFSNTLGFALEYSARGVEDTLKQTALLSEASKIFEEALDKNPSDPYSYLGLFNVLKQKIDRESGAARQELQASALSLLTEAWEETGESEKIAGELGNLRSQLGSLQDGIDIVKPALEKKPTDVRLRDLLVRFLYEKRDYGEALNVAREGSRLDPTSWRLQRWLARLRQQETGTINIAVIKGNYEAALRHHKGDVGLMVEYAAFLFMQLELEDAKTQFQSVKSLTIAAQEKRRVRGQWKEQDGSLSIFTGKIQPFKGPQGTVLSIPQNFEASFWRGALGTRIIREGETVRFTVNFTGNGPEARILNIKVSNRLITS